MYEEARSLLKQSVCAQVANLVKWHILYLRIYNRYVIYVTYIRCTTHEENRDFKKQNKIKKEERGCNNDRAAWPAHRPAARKNTRAPIHLPKRSKAESKKKVGRTKPNGHYVEKNASATTVVAKLVARICPLDDNSRQEKRQWWWICSRGSG